MKGLLVAICFTLMSLSVSAQVERIDIGIFGNYELTVRVGEGQYVVVDEYGQLLYLDIEGRWSFYDDFWAYQANKVKRIGSVDFAYFDDFWDYQAGKIKRVGSVNFLYNNNFWGYKSGKLNKVGSMSIEYYNDFADYQAGKVRKLGSVNVDYYSDWGFDGNEKYIGLIKSIDGSQYNYRRVSDARPGRVDNAPMSHRAESDRYRGNTVQSAPGQQQGRPSGGIPSQVNPQHGVPPIPASRRPNVSPRPGSSRIVLEGRRQFMVGNVQVVVHDELY